MKQARKNQGSVRAPKNENLRISSVQTNARANLAVETIQKMNEDLKALMTKYTALYTNIQSLEGKHLGKGKLTGSM